MKLEIPFDYSDLKQIHLGLTNHNYLITIDNETYIVRVPREDLNHLFNRDHEQQVLHQIKDEPYVLNPYFYKNGIQVVPYQKNLINFEDYSSSDKIQRVASLMKAFHQSDVKVDFNFDPKYYMDTYIQYAKNLDINMEDYTEIFTFLKSHRFEPTLCHNDWVAGNICYLNHKTYLIDYEYAGNNDKRFDIMSFITENDLSKEEKHEFIHLMYPNGISEDEAYLLMMYRDVNNLLWYLWAKMMYTVRKEAIYLDISKIKRHQLVSTYSKPLDFL